VGAVGVAASRRGQGEDFGEHSRESFPAAASPPTTFESFRQVFEEPIPMKQDTHRHVVTLVVTVLAAAVAGLAQPSASQYSEAISVTPVLRTSENTIGQAIEYPRTGTPEVSALLVEIPPGQQTGWHKHPVPIFAYVLSGTLTEEFSDGKKFDFHPGQALAEAVETAHNGYNAGSDPVKLILFVMGEKGVPFTVHLGEK
jgi:quercetin dioxygenase-like cupin family protein